MQDLIIVRNTYYGCIKLPGTEDGIGTAGQLIYI